MLNTRLRSILLVGILSLGATIVQAGENLSMVTKEYELENGLKVVVREDHRAPVVVSQIWYKVGSADETRPLTGISHVLEHMMFQGTPKLPGEGFSQLIAEHGGYTNAFTASDFTAYYEEVDKTKLEMCFEVEADRMRNLLLDEKNFKNEMQVVMEERRMRYDDKPRSATYERFMAQANPAGPYHHSVIGWMDDLVHLEVAKVRAWYEKWYAPNNAILVVVGDVEGDDVFQLAKKHFGHLPKLNALQHRAPQEISALGEQRLKVELPAQLPFFIMGYRVPTAITAPEDLAWEPFALTVAAAALDGGESARFAKELVRDKEIAVHAGAEYDVYRRFDTQFLLSGTPHQAHTVATLEEHFLEQVQRLKTKLLLETELSRIKAQVIAQDVYDKDSMSHQAIGIGALESIGASWQDLDAFASRIQAVTAEQVQQVAQKYFISERLTVAELVPLPMTASAQNDAPGEGGAS